MEPENFKSLIKTFGTNPNAWPKESRDAALDTMNSLQIENDPELKAELDLDRVLEDARLQHGSDILKQRIMTQIKHTENSLIFETKPAIRWPAIAAMVVASFGAGLFGGQYVAQPTTESVYQVVENTESDWTEIEYLGLSDFYDWVSEEG